MKNLLFEVGICKISLMRRLKSHRLLLTQLQIIVAGSHLISVPCGNNSRFQSFRTPRCLEGSAWEEGKLQTELLDIFLPSVVLFQLGHSFWRLNFPLRDADLHQCNFLQSWQKPNFAAPAPWHSSHRVFFAVFGGPGSHSLNKCSSRKHTGALMWKLECGEISHNVFFWPFALQGCQILKWKNARIFKREKGRTIGVIPEKSRFHIVLVWSKAFRYWTFSYKPNPQRALTTTQWHWGITFHKSSAKTLFKKIFFSFPFPKPGKVLWSHHITTSKAEKDQKSKQKTQNQNNTKPQQSHK